jgi:hypothetical protein
MCGVRKSSAALISESMLSMDATVRSWLNAGDKNFGESDPVLATAFAVLTLSYCKPAK